MLLFRCLVWQCLEWVILCRVFVPVDGEGVAIATVSRLLGRLSTPGEDSLAENEVLPCTRVSDDHSGHVILQGK